MKSNRRNATPDAWMQLVLKSMSVDEIKTVLRDGEETDPVKVAGLKAELRKRGAR